MKRFVHGKCIVAVLVLAVATSSWLIGAERASAALVPVSLRCEYASDPLGVDSPNPRLSWQLESASRAQAQTAYEILAAASTKWLADGKGDLWDSGKVFTNQSIGVPYQGRPLHSEQPAFWKVRVWDNTGRPSDWSQPAKWEMGLLSPQAWQAQWLNDGKANPDQDADFYHEDPAPLLRKEFTVAKPVVRARLHICGLGYYEASLNGQRVGDRVLDPGWTRYSEGVLYSPTT